MSPTTKYFYEINNTIWLSEGPDVKNIKPIYQELLTERPELF